MANRAYLYSVDQRPEKDNRDDLKIRGLSEWSLQIPLSYLMLISGNPTLLHSIIWDKAEMISLFGDYTSGLKNLISLINLIKKSSPQSPDVYERVSKETIDFLESEKVKQKFIVLEAGEILDMLKNVTTNGASSILEDARKLVNAVEDENLEAINKYVGEDIRTHWEDLLGINNWSNILYVDLNQN